MSLESRLRYRYIRGGLTEEFVTRCALDLKRIDTRGVRGGKYVQEHWREVRDKLKLGEWRETVRLPGAVRAEVESAGAVHRN